MRSINYYKILQVDPSAEPEVIEAAYRRLALKYHPDKNKSPEATHRMQEINEAYSVLGNIAQREKYDKEQGFQISQRNTWAEDVERQRRDAEQTKRAQEEIHRSTEYERQKGRNRKQTEKELISKLCMNYLEGDQLERRRLMQEVVSLGAIAIKALIDSLCDEATAINHELLPREDLDQTAILSDSRNWEKRNDFVRQQMNILEPQARARLEDKFIAASEVLIKLTKTGDFQEVDQQVMSAFHTQPPNGFSSIWIILILMYYSAKILGDKIIYWAGYARKSLGLLEHKNLSGLWQEIRTMDWFLSIIAADAGNLQEQKWLTICAGDKDAAEFRAQLEEKIIDEACANLIRFRNEPQLQFVYQFLYPSDIEQYRRTKGK